MTSAEHRVRCTGLRSGATESEKAIIADYAETEECFQIAHECMAEYRSRVEAAEKKLAVAEKERDRCATQADTYLGYWNSAQDRAEAAEKERADLLKAIEDEFDIEDGKEGNPRPNYAMRIMNAYEIARRK